jgi:hypothetical protein
MNSLTNKPQSDEYKGNFDTQHTAWLLEKIATWLLEKIEKKIDTIGENIKPQHVTGAIPPKELLNKPLREGDFVEHATR